MILLKPKSNSITLFNKFVIRREFNTNQNNNQKQKQKEIEWLHDLQTGVENLKIRIHERINLYRNTLYVKGVGNGGSEHSYLSSDIVKQKNKKFGIYFSKIFLGLCFYYTSSYTFLFLILLSIFSSFLAKSYLLTDSVKYDNSLCVQHNFISDKENLNQSSNIFPDEENSNQLNNIFPGGEYSNQSSNIFPVSIELNSDYKFRFRPLIAQGLPTILLFVGSVGFDSFDNSFSNGMSKYNMQRGFSLMKYSSIYLQDLGGSDTNIIFALLIFFLPVVAIFIICSLIVYLSISLARLELLSENIKKTEEIIADHDFEVTRIDSFLRGGNTTCHNNLTKHLMLDKVLDGSETQSEVTVEQIPGKIALLSYTELKKLEFIHFYFNELNPTNERVLKPEIEPIYRGQRQRQVLLPFFNNYTKMNIILIGFCLILAGMSTHLF